MICYLFYNISFNAQIGSVFGRIRINWCMGSVILHYRSVYPDPKEIFTDQQHCFKSWQKIYVVISHIY
jgi:hypothetical protein